MVPGLHSELGAVQRGIRGDPLLPSPAANTPTATTRNCSGAAFLSAIYPPTSWSGKKFMKFLPNMGKYLVRFDVGKKFAKYVVFTFGLVHDHWCIETTRHLKLFPHFILQGALNTMNSWRPKSTLLLLKRSSANAVSTWLIFPTAVSILRGYGFVQFMLESDAREAVRMENGGLLKGNKLGRCQQHCIPHRSRTFVRLLL